MNKEKYCPNCRKPMENTVEVCPKCGYHFVKIEEQAEEMAQTNTVIINDRVPTWVWWLIGFICPVAGLVLYIVWNKTHSRRSIIAGKGTLVGTIIWVAIFVCYFIYLFGLTNGFIE